MDGAADRRDSGIVSLGNEGAEEEGEEVIVVGTEPPSGVSITFKELQGQEEEAERKKRKMW